MSSSERTSPTKTVTNAATTVAAALLAVATVVRAQTRPTSAPTITGPTTASTRNGDGGEGVRKTDQGLVLNFRDASINVVLDELSAAAGFIVVKEFTPQGRVTLTSRQPVSAEEAVSLLNTVLNNAGASAIQQDRILKIVAKDRAKKLNIPVRSGSDPSKIAKTDELITQVIPLRHANATELRQDLQPLIAPEADFTANASSNSLVMTDTSANVRRLVEIIAAMDTSLAGSVEVKVFQLKYANAVNAAKLINDVFGELTVGTGQGGGQGQGQGGRGGQGQGGGGGPFGGFGQGGQGGGWQRFMQQMQGGGGQQGGNRQARKIVNAAADDRTNAVVVTGPGDTLNIVAQVIRDIDANPVADETVFVYRLRNAQAANIESVVNALFGNATTGNRSAANQNSNNQLRGNQRTSSGNNRTTGGFGGGGNTGGFGANRAAGGGGFGGGGFGGGGGGFGAWQAGGGFFGGGRTISANAQQTAAGLAGQVTIIADPDTNSLLVRTTPSNFERVRTVLEELDRAVAQVLIKVLIAEITHTNAYDIGAELSVLNLRASGLGQNAGTNFNIPTEGAAATGLVVQILEQDFTAAVRLLETEGKLDVLSRPYILASDNQLASITVGQEVPFITNSRVTDEGGIVNTIDYRDIGILLDVIPHINPDGLVILDVAPEISTLTAERVPVSELVEAPVIAKRSAQSRVGVRNGQTIVIGGLMEDRKTSTVRKVPILGDIPLVGNAFKRTDMSKSKTELLIFLTPHVAALPEMLGGMGEEEVQGTQLVPNAVAPGKFKEHMEGMQRGRTVDKTPATLPSGRSTVIEVPPQVPPPARGGDTGGSVPDAGPAGPDFGPGPVPDGGSMD